ncbi:hypothetical protein [Herbaspirillum sp. YR522]|uniref:hypothetical protein n=1 Tax=Herbaspirillum sp. YR522 TaxID=1144342 RepID=UPI0012F98A9A|nr:hypothetical protein [Herbaspirillum sp. YR522]
MIEFTIAELKQKNNLCMHCITNSYAERRLAAIVSRLHGEEAIKRLLPHFSGRKWAL